MSPNVKGAVFKIWYFLQFSATHLTHYDTTVINRGSCTLVQCNLCIYFELSFEHYITYDQTLLTHSNIK